MKISEVINKLQEIQKEHGDMEVVTYYDPYGSGYDIALTNKHITVIEENDELKIGY